MVRPRTFTASAAMESRGINTVAALRGTRPIFPSKALVSYEKIGSSIYYPAKVEDANAAAAFSTDANVAPPQGAAYFRVSARGSGENLVVTLDEELT